MKKTYLIVRVKATAPKRHPHEIEPRAIEIVDRVFLPPSSPMIIAKLVKWLHWQTVLYIDDFLMSYSQPFSFESFHRDRLVSRNVHIGL